MALERPRLMQGNVNARNLNINDENEVETDRCSHNRSVPTQRKLDRCEHEAVKIRFRCSGAFVDTAAQGINDHDTVTPGQRKSIAAMNM